MRSASYLSGQSLTERTIIVRAKLAKGYRFIFFFAHVDTSRVRYAVDWGLPHERLASDIPTQNRA